MTKAGTLPRLCTLYGFDHEQMAANVSVKKAELGLSFSGLAAETGVSRPVLLEYFASRPRVVRVRKRCMSAETAIKIMMWLGDFDIRDYLLEER